MKKNTFYVTTPIYYVTAAPHLGSLYSTLLADVAARYHRLMGKDVFFLTGTDEHGQKVAEAAHKAGKSPQAFVDSFIPAYIDMWKHYNIEYTKFIRTTDQQHVQAVSKWIQQLLLQGDIYKGQYEGWYCTPCETYVTQKDGVLEDVEITCPSCLRPTIKLVEESYFFKLSAYQDRLLEFYEKNPNFITPKERAHEVISFIKEGLKDLSISRTTVSWGIPFPGDSEHVTYVWADALNNYITAIGYGSVDGQDTLHHWWPANMQILGKDIVRFHGIYWPAFLMATGLAMPKTLLVHGWIKVGDLKMSKSLGNAVDPYGLAATYGVDEIRYYLTRKMAITQDAQFSVADIEQSINSELANDLGNLLNRCLVLAQKYNYMTIHDNHDWTQSSQNLQKACHDMVHETRELIEAGYFYRAVSRVWECINQVNAYMQESAPWKVVATDRKSFEQSMAAVVYSLRAVAVLLWPVMPTKMDKLLASLGCSIEPSVGSDRIKQLCQWQGNCNLTIIDPLFQKYEKKPEEKIMETKMNKLEAEQEATVAQEVPTVSIDDLVKIDLRVGLIEQCEIVEKSDKLLKLQVDFGPLGKRQILSGVRKFLSPDDLIGKKAAFIVNLPVRMMMGLPSQGMMFAAESDGKLSILQPHLDAAPGTKIK